MAKEQSFARRPNRSGTATRAKILEASINLMVEQGLEGFTLQSAAERADVLYGTVTHHFGTRENLVESMLECLVGRFQARFAELAQSIATADRPVETLVAQFLDDALQERSGPIFLCLCAMTTLRPSLAERMRRLIVTAIEDCIAALGGDPGSEDAQPLRIALYVMWTIMAGAAALLATLGPNDPVLLLIRRDAVAVLVPLLETRQRTAGAAGA